MIFSLRRILDSDKESRTLVGNSKVDHRINEVFNLILRHCFTEHHGLSQQEVFEHSLALVASEGLVPALTEVPSTCNQLRVISVIAVETNAIEKKVIIPLTEVVLDYQTI